MASNQIKDEEKKKKAHRKTQSIKGEKRVLGEIKIGGVPKKKTKN